jgi:hypothetical protein
LKKNNSKNKGNNKNNDNNSKNKGKKTATTICANSNKHYQQGRGIKIHLSSCMKKQGTQNYLQ